jgi:hypothetical protein
VNLHGIIGTARAERCACAPSGLEGHKRSHLHQRGFSWEGPGKPGYTLSPLTFNVQWGLEQLEILASRRCVMAESLNLVVEQDQAGLWHVTSPNIPGLVATGHSRREALSNVDGAISHLQRVERFAGIVTDDALRCGA